jgi:hypothetical protein
MGIYGYWVLGVGCWVLGFMGVGIYGCWDLGMFCEWCGMLARLELLILKAKLQKLHIEYE